MKFEQLDKIKKEIEERIIEGKNKTSENSNKLIITKENMFEKDTLKTIISTQTSTILVTLLVSMIGLGFLGTSITLETGTLLILGVSIPLGLLAEKIIFKDFSLKKKLQSFFSIKKETKNAEDIIKNKIEEKKIKNTNRINEQIDELIFEEILIPRPYDL